MAQQRYDFPVPVADRVTDPAGLVRPIWLRWFNFVRDRLGIVSETATTYDPPNILSGAVSSVSVAFDGAKPGDKAWATHTQVTAGIIILATATTDSVTVTFWNISGGAINLASGVLRVGVETTT